MNARGIPPAAYQVLHLLSYPEGTPSLDGGYPIPGQGYPISGWGLPHPWLGDLISGKGRGYLIPGWGTPIWTWPGYPMVWTWLGRDLGPVTGVPPRKGPRTSHWGMPRKDMGPVEVLYDGDWVPFPGCEQTDACENSTFPSYYIRGRQK